MNVIWISGLSGSGKSTIGKKVVEVLRKNGEQVVYLDGDELRKVFYKRSLLDLFDGGIYGSPATKDQILRDLKKKNLLNLPSLFIGDSRYDHEAAKDAGLDFIFVKEFSEWDNWGKIINTKYTVKNFEEFSV